MISTVVRDNSIIASLANLSKAPTRKVLKGTVHYLQYTEYDALDVLTEMHVCEIILQIILMVLWSFKM